MIHLSSGRNMCCTRMCFPFSLFFLLFNRTCIMLETSSQQMYAWIYDRCIFCNQVLWFCVELDLFANPRGKHWNQHAKEFDWNCLCNSLNIFSNDTDQNHSLLKLSMLMMLDAFIFWTCYFVWIFQWNDLWLRQKIIIPLAQTAWLWSSSQIGTALWESNCFFFYRSGIPSFTTPYIQSVIVLERNLHR